jgi:hypothetical protein
MVAGNGLTLSLKVDQQDKMWYAFQQHSFFLLGVDKNIHQLQAPAYVDKSKITGKTLTLETAKKN